MNLLHDKRNIASVITNPANGETIWNGSLYFLMSINSLRNIILNNDIWTLTYIIHHNDFIIAKLLLDKFIQYYDPLGDDSLLTASVYGSLEMVQFLFENGCNYREVIEYVSPDIKIIKYNIKNYVEYSPTYLHYYADRNYHEIIRYMFKYGIWTSQTTIILKDFVIQLCQSKKIEILQTVIKHMIIEWDIDIYKAIIVVDNIDLIRNMLRFRKDHLTPDLKRQLIRASSRQFEIIQVYDEILS